MNIGSILRDFDAHLSVRWRTGAPLLERSADGLEMEARIYEAGRDGIPFRGGDSSAVTHSIDGRLLASLQRTGGGGPLIDAIMRQVRDSSERVIREHTLRRLVRRIDQALFAMDHDGGHGPDVASSGVRELWAASDPDTWRGYAEKREAALRWIEEFSNDPRVGQ